jgi:hypothetical protein
MSLEHIKTVVENFISDTRDELLVISGKWGVGKTYFWHKVIEDSKKKRCIGRTYYSYVSLFGVNSLEELKNAIIASRVESNAGKILTKIDMLMVNLKQLTSRAHKVPKLHEYTGGLANEFLFYFIDNTLICFDDLERKGNDLNIKDILGLAAVLKEQRGCKVVMILNDEGFDVDAQAAEFKQHGEKIIDRKLEFKITEGESFDYAFQSSTPFYEVIKKSCVKLHITNIRTLQRIRRHIDDVTPFLRGAEKQVAESAVNSLILFVWSYYEQAAGAPPLRFVLDYSPVNSYLAKQNKKELSEKEKKWNEVMGSYSYYRTDDVDKCFAEFIETGYVDKPQLLSALDKENRQHRVLQGQHSLSEAWDMFRSSFDDNEQEFIDALEDACRSNMEVISLQNLQNVLTTLREFERGDLADSLVDEYFDKHNSEEEIKAIARLRGTIEVNDLKDSYLRSRLDQIWESDEFDKRSLPDVVKELTFKSGWSEDDVRRLDSFTADDYYAFFKSGKSPDLYLYVRKCLEFGKFEGGTGIYKSIGDKAKKALLRIAPESKLNRVRISSLFDIDVDADDDMSGSSGCASSGAKGGEAGEV